MATPKPLFNLPALAGADVVIFCEGEKSAQLFNELGFVCTTSAGGASNATLDVHSWESLAGKTVVIFPDHDEPGSKYADDVALILATKINPPANVRIAILPDLPAGGDVVDFIAAQRPDADVADLIGEAIATAEDWVDFDQSLRPPSPTWRPFPTDVLPEPARSFVKQGAKAIGCDEAYLALPLLSALASAIGGTRRLQLKRGWSEPAILWTAIVGESGAKKSPPMDTALKPIKNKQRKAMKLHKAAYEQYEIDLHCYDKSFSAWKRIKGNDEPPVKPDAPVADRCWVNDATVEALAVLLQEQPRGLLMACDELAAWFGSMDRYSSGKGSDTPKWLEMHGGRSMLVDRKMNRQALFIERAAVSLTGTIQPHTFKRALGRENMENGLAARLLMASPPRIVAQWTEAEIDRRVELSVESLFDRLYGLQPDTNDEGDWIPRTVRLSDEGKCEWVRFYNEHALEQSELTGHLAAAWSKLEGYCARFALVIHLIRVATDDQTISDPDAVDAASVKAGVALVRWFGNEARRIYSSFDETETDSEHRQLTEKIQSLGGVITVRELYKSSRQYTNAEAARQALDGLVNNGYGVWDNPAPKAGDLRMFSRLYPPYPYPIPLITTPLRGVMGTGTP